MSLGLTISFTVMILALINMAWLLIGLTTNGVSYVKHCNKHSGIALGLMAISLLSLLLL